MPGETGATDLLHERCVKKLNSKKRGGYATCAAAHPASPPGPTVLFLAAAGRAAGYERHRVYVRRVGDGAQSL